MKNICTGNRPETVKILVWAFVLLSLPILVLPLAVQAANAGNTVVRNYVSVAYKDAANNDLSSTAYVDITVNTVASAPVVMTFTPDPGSTDGTGATQQYTVRIRTSSNGPGSISASGADGTPTNISVSATTPSIPGSPIFLGATLLDPTDAHIGSLQSVSNSSGITFVVPNDGGIPSDTATSGGNTSDGAVNGLKSGDTVYLYSGTTPYGPFTVGTVTENAVGTGSTAATDSIELTNTSGGTLSFTPSAGWQILESKTVTMTVTQGVVTNPAQAASWVTTVTAAMSGNNGTNSVTTNAHVSSLSVTKEFSSTGASGTFTTTSAGFAPGATVTYRITVTNSGTGSASNVTLTDAQPKYTTYTASSAKFHTGSADNAYTSGTTLTDAENSNDDGYDYGATTANTATYIIGTLASGSSVELFFQVTVN
jgi:uncharacterized repeat protein (TIGR01451 family)